MLGNGVRMAAVVDVETTVDQLGDKIIQLAVVRRQ